MLHPCNYVWLCLFCQDIRLINTHEKCTKGVFFNICYLVEIHDASCWQRNLHKLCIFSPAVHSAQNVPDWFLLRFLNNISKQRSIQFQSQQKKICKKGFWSNSVLHSPLRMLQQRFYLFPRAFSGDFQSELKPFGIDFFVQFIPVISVGLHQSAL